MARPRRQWPRRPWRPRRPRRPRRALSLAVAVGRQCQQQLCCCPLSDCARARGRRVERGAFLEAGARCTRRVWEYDARRQREKRKRFFFSFGVVEGARNAALCEKTARTYMCRRWGARESSRAYPNWITCMAVTVEKSTPSPLTHLFLPTPDDCADTQCPRWSHHWQGRPHIQAD